MTAVLTKPAQAEPTSSKPTLAKRIDSATPKERNRTVDAIRALAIAGVVLGHWLVTAFVAFGDGRLGVASPLQAMPWATPVSWVLQTLAPFFLVGGFTSALGYRPGEGYLPWMRKRIGRLARPVPALLLFWAALAPVLWLGGVAPSSIEAMLRLVLSPLWFLGVFAGLTALTPVLVRLWERLGWLAVGLSAGIVAVVDVVRFAVGGPVWLGWVNLLAGWAVPFLIGIAWSKGRAPSREAAWALLGGGIAATAGLVLFAGYPASMVGVPGAAISNLNPPTLAAVTFGLAQAGLIMLVKDRLGRLMRKPLAWAGTVVLNLSAMTVFLWHQTAMMLVTVGALTFGILPGLHTPPADGSWIGARLLWLMPIAAALAGLRIVFQRYENPKIK